MLRLNNIVKHYPTATTTVQALRGVSLAFREAEFVAILGPSGCGKTTMLNIIGGLDRYTDGDLIIGGVSTADFDDLHWDAYRNATIGFVFQSYNLIPHLTVLENVELALSLVGQKKKIRRAKAVAALHRVGMGAEINKRPNQLSGGQMQRVAIARAIVNDPKIILADEPTGALDSELSVQVMDILSEISKTRLVIMVTHNAELANAYCSRICRFKDGQLISDSNPYDPAEEALEEGFLVGESADEQEESALGLATTDTGATDGLSDGNVTEEEGEVVLDTAKDGEPTAEGEAPIEDIELLPEEKAPTEGEELSEGEAPTEDIALDEAPQSGEEHAPETLDAEDVDYSAHVLEGKDVKLKNKRVSNHKRKKTMKRMGTAANPMFNKLGLNSLNKHKKRHSSFKPTSMSMGMAFGLSLRNLISKRRRTFFTAFAGSIGIIGLGLVLAISNGFSVFVDRMQTDMLAGVPLGVYEYNVEVSVLSDIMGAFSQKTPENAFPETDKIVIDDSASQGSDMINQLMETFFKSVSMNELSEDFARYMQNMPKENYGAMSVFYGQRFNLISYFPNENNVFEYKDVSRTPSVSTALGIATTILGENGIQPDFWQQLVGDEESMTKAYDFVGENSRYPKKPNEILLCVNESNQISGQLLETMGIKLYERTKNGDYILDSATGKLKPISTDNITADDFLGLKLRLVMNNDYYKKLRDVPIEGEMYEIYEVPDDCDSETKDWRYSSQDRLKEIYEASADDGMDLEIVGVIRPKHDVKAGYVENSLCYTPELASIVLENAYNSDIAKAQRKYIAFDAEEYKDSKEKQGSTVFDKFKADDEISDGLNILSVISNSLDYTSFNKAIGAIKEPTYIAVYPETYQQKLDTSAYIKAWNNDHKTADGKPVVGFFDVSEMLIYNLNMIINLVSTLLVAVASISLVVSTVMIGVITSNSVIERTREIGILRSLGARKKDIRHVFLAETALIGLAGGLMGIIITYILCPIISLIVGAVSGVADLLHFNPLHALLLVVLSFILTIISGIVPAISASRKNVVDALRVE